MNWQKLYNPLILAVLRSPLHGLLSKSILAVTYMGSKSGRQYTLPVNYVRDDGIFLTISLSNRTWWRNLRGGAPVMLRVRGEDLRARSEVLEDSQLVAESLLTVLRLAPAYRRYLKIDLTPDGQAVDPAALAQLAHNRVVVRFSDLVPVRS